MSDVDLFGQLGQVKRLFRSRIAAAHDDHSLVSEEKPVAHRAIRNAFAVIVIFPRDTQLARAAAGAQNHGMGLQHLAVIQMDLMPVQARLDFGHFLIAHLQPVRFGMLNKFHGQFSPAGVLEPRVVFHLIRHGDLAAGHAFFDKDRLERGPHGIDAGGKAAGPASHDNQIIRLVF